LSPSSILKLKADWQQEYEAWKKRPLRGRYVYLYADGLYLKAGAEQDKTALPVVLGVDENGHKVICTRTVVVILENAMISDPFLMQKLAKKHIRDLLLEAEQDRLASQAIMFERAGTAATVICRRKSLCDAIRRASARLRTLPSRKVALEARNHG